MITAVTTCMGRREHLETTLPFMLAEFDRVIVVDWSCPQKAWEVAAKEGAGFVCVSGQKYFNMSRARNAGLAEVTTEYVAFVDADTLCMPGTGDELRQGMTFETMALASRDSDNYDIENLFGFLCVPTNTARRLKGYDESFEGWGHEDSHMRGRCFLEGGLKPRRVSGMRLGAIAHSNELRDVNFALPITRSSSINYLKLIEYFRTQGIKDWMLDPRTESITYRMRPNA